MEIPKASTEIPKAGMEIPITEAEKPLASLTFREASEELEGIVRSLEANQLELEDALKYYERGVRLLRELQARLAGAEQQVTVLMGALEAESSDITDTTLS